MRAPIDGARISLHTNQSTNPRERGHGYSDLIDDTDGRAAAPAEKKGFPNLEEEKVVEKTDNNNGKVRNSYEGVPYEAKSPTDSNPDKEQIKKDAPKGVKIVPDKKAAGNIR